MNQLRSCFLLLSVFLILSVLDCGVAGARFGADQDEKARFLAKLQRGMTPEQVRNHVGPPQRISRQILYHRYREQWIYEAPVAARLTFDCPRGQKPQLVGY